MSRTFEILADAYGWDCITIRERLTVAQLQMYVDRFCERIDRANRRQSATETARPASQYISSSEDWALSRAAGEVQVVRVH